MRAKRTMKIKRRRTKLSKLSRKSLPERIDNNESAQSEAIDRLLLSSLKFWEVERDLIEERMSAVCR